MNQICNIIPNTRSFLNSIRIITNSRIYLHRQLSASGRIITAKLQHPVTESLGADRFHHRLNIFILQKIIRYHQIVFFYGQWDKIQIKGSGLGINRHAAIGGSAQHIDGHGHMSTLFMLISFDGSRFYAGQGQVVVEQDAGA